MHLSNNFLYQQEINYRGRSFDLRDNIRSNGDSFIFVNKLFTEPNQYKISLLPFLDYNTEIMP